MGILAQREISIVFRRVPQVVCVERIEAGMSEKPIIFSGPMVRAILDGRKTMTRRIIKPQPFNMDRTRLVYRASLGGWTHEEASDFAVRDREPGHNLWKSYQPGDVLWVRETHWRHKDVTPRMLREGADTWPGVIFDVDGDVEFAREHGWSKCPSIHLRRCHARILLRVTDVRVQRLQEISEEDAIAEGCPFAKQPLELSFCAEWFQRLWNTIHGPGACDVNPWVWVYTFERQA